MVEHRINIIKNDMMYVCKYCGKELKRPCALGIHERTCKNNPNRKPLEKHVCGYGIYRAKTSNVEDNRRCKFCGKACKNENSCQNHERTCPKNPDRKYVNGMKGKPAWNKGLTKETDSRVAKSANTLKQRYADKIYTSPSKGKSMSEEQKKKISDTMKRYLSDNPSKTPYVLNHHSHGDSYPEKYFKSIFDFNNIKYEQNYFTCGYFLDFAFVDSKQYIEIDGEQHYVDNRIVKHDKIRTDKLLKNGWECIMRVRWSEYKKMEKSEQEEFVTNMIKLIMSR